MKKRKEKNILSGLKKRLSHLSITVSDKGMAFRYFPHSFLAYRTQNFFFLFEILINATEVGRTETKVKKKKKNDSR